jgi:hypothetical protein
MEIKIEPQKAARILGIVVLGLSLAHAAGLFSRFVLGHDTVFGLVDLFDLNSEKNLPTFYASASLLLCAGLLSLLARMRWPNREWVFWAFLAVVFAFLSYDEAVEIHEGLIQPLQTAWNTSGYLRYAWIIPYGIFSLFLLISSIWVLRSLPRRTLVLFILAGGIYVFGAIGFEMISGNQADLAGKDVVFEIYALLEEVFEMAGIVLFIYALLDTIAGPLGGVKIIIPPIKRS